MVIKNTADVYYRLSKDDLRGGDESGSISNQRVIVEKFCNEHGISIVREFVDDGYSGGNFDRPGFKAMLDHIEQEKIAMVITKDLSRLGRDMTESSRYAEEYFPEHDVVYIAVSDNFSSDQNNSLSPFLFAFNDFYLRDTSRKIRNVLGSKRENGEYCCCAPFGYMKNPADKTKLVPNPETAGIVQQIFHLAEEGKGSHTIADILTNEGIVTPSIYKLNGNYNSKSAERANPQWTHTTVKRILQNKVYLGHTILGKSKKINYKSKKKKSLPESEWSVHENTHQPLVSKETFETANNYIGIHKKTWREYDQIRKSIFSGVVFCKNCGGALCSSGTVYKGEREKYWYLSCNNITNKKRPCNCGARIKYATLIEIISAELNTLISLSKEQIDCMVDKLMKEQTGIGVFETKEKKLKVAQKKADDLLLAIKKLYKDYAAGIISEDIHNQLLSDYQQQYNDKKEQIKQLEKDEDVANSIKDSYELFYSLIQEHSHFDTLTSEIVRTFIDRIEVGEKQLPPGYKIASHTNIPCKQEIVIYYRFIGNGITLNL